MAARSSLEVGQLKYKSTKKLGPHNSAAMATIENTTAEINASPLISYQTHDRESKNFKAGLPCHQLPALMTVSFHNEMNLKTLTQLTHET